MAVAYITSNPPAIHWMIQNDATNSVRIFGDNIPLQPISKIGDEYFDIPSKNRDAMYYSNRIKINELIEKWVKETFLLSDVNQIISNDNFKKIIELGTLYPKSTIQIILDRIDFEPSPIVWALNEITKTKISQEPISIEEACRMWVNWGYDKNIL